MHVAGEILLARGLLYFWLHHYMYEHFQHLCRPPSLLHRPLVSSGCSRLYERFTNHVGARRWATSFFSPTRGGLCYSCGRCATPPLPPPPLVLRATHSTCASSAAAPPDSTRLKRCGYLVPLFLPLFGGGFLCLSRVFQCFLLCYSCKISLNSVL